MNSQVILAIGTRKGAFVAISDSARSEWELKGPFLKGLEVNHIICSTDAPGPGRCLYAAGKSAWWGPGIQTSVDLGDTWEELEGARFGEDRGLTVERIWALAVDGRRGPGVVYSGVDPGSLFRSGDSCRSWDEVRSLNDHSTRDSWQPGAGGLMVHSISFDPGDPERMFVGISAAGVFRTDDGGASWSPKNKGVRADFLPDRFPHVGQCVHHLEMHSSDPRTLYQQNHCGVYRSDNAGDDWIDISDGLPSRFGFPIAVHPHDGDTVYVIPEESDQYRVTPDGAFRIYRSRDRGDNWEALTNGLPQTNAYQNVLRQAMSTDSLDSAGIYVGTQGGQLLLSRDSGDHWELIFNWLPPISSVECASFTS